MPATPKTWERLGKLVGMLSSTFDGEVLVARAKINKLLVDNGLSWADLAQRVANVSNKASVIAEEAADPDDAAAYPDGYPYWHGARLVCYGTIVRITHKALLVHFTHRASVDWMPLSMMTKAPYPQRIGAAGEFWLDAWIVRKKGLESYD